MQPTEPGAHLTRALRARMNPHDLVLRALTTRSCMLGPARSLVARSHALERPCPTDRAGHLRSSRTPAPCACTRGSHSKEWLT
jgi:hypothetical protein